MLTLRTLASRLSFPRLHEHASNTLALLAWCLAILFAAWTASTLIWRALTPDTVIAMPQIEHDPRKAAADIVRALGGLQRKDPIVTPAVQQDPAYQLIGLATGFGRLPGFVLIRDASGATHALRIGDPLPDGRHLDSIQADHAVLLRHGVTTTLRLPDLAGAPLTTLRTAATTDADHSAD